MLSLREKNGMRKLLENISEKDLFRLVNTVTKRLAVVSNRKEATKAILLFTDNAEQFLRRKLVKRDLIFNYLADHDVPISPTAVKEIVIQKVLECWQSAETWSEINETDDSPPRKSSWFQELAVQFTVWFFTKLHENHLQHPSHATMDWGPKHFFGNVNLNLCVLRGTDQLQDTYMYMYDGSVNVSQRLGCLVKEEELVFSPNLSKEGTLGRRERHGLVIIAVCGTIHKADTCIGLFEQHFGLARDPVADNNWKIKTINMQIKDGSSQNVPTLGQLSQLNTISA